ncbi:hypothetical protein VPH35_092361 [Triticum aestivum]
MTRWPRRRRRVAGGNRAGKGAHGRAADAVEDIRRDIAAAAVRAVGRRRRPRKGPGARWWKRSCGAGELLWTRRTAVVFVVERSGDKGNAGTRPRAPDEVRAALSGRETGPATAVCQSSLQRRRFSSSAMTVCQSSLQRRRFSSSAVYRWGGAEAERRGGSSRRGSGSKATKKTGRQWPPDAAAVAEAPAARPRRKPVDGGRPTRQQSPRRRQEGHEENRSTVAARRGSSRRGAGSKATKKAGRRWPPEAAERVTDI